MALPVFDFDNAPASGMIGSKAAELFMQQGAALGKAIEKRALTAEAQAKAPALAAAYADGLTRLSQGDMTGMELLTRARAESVGNPFLSAMTDDATKEGARIAGMYIEKTLAEKRLTQNQDQFDATLKDRAEFRQDTLDAREDDKTEQRLAARDAQSEREYNDQKAQVDRENAARQQRNIEMQQANELARQNGQPETPFTPMPMLPSPNKPSFKSRTYGGAGTATDDVVGVSFGAGVNPTGLPDSKVQANGPLFSPGEAPPMLPEDNVEPTLTQAPKKALVNEKEPEIVKQQVGNLMFEIPKATQIPSNKRTQSVKVGGVTTSYESKTDQTADPAKQLAEALKVVNRDPALSDWVAKNRLKGNRILVKPKMEKGKVVGYNPFSVGPDGIHTPFKHKSMVQQKDSKTGKPLTNADGTPMVKAEENVVMEIDAEVANALNESIELLEGPMKGKVSVKIAQTDEKKNETLAIAFDNLLKRKMDLKTVNESLRKVSGIREITEDDIRAVQSRMTRGEFNPNAKNVNPKYRDTWVSKEVIDLIKKKYLQ